VHYLSAHQMTGGPRSKGPTSRAAASRSTSGEPDVSDGTPTTSSDGSGLRQRHSLESPFLAKARIANAQSQAAIASAIASRNAVADVYGGAVAPPRPQIGPNLRPRTASQLAPQQQSQMPPPQRMPLSGRPAAIAAAAAGHPAYSSSISKVGTPQYGPVWAVLTDAVQRPSNLAPYLNPVVAMYETACNLAVSNSWRVRAERFDAHRGPHAAAAVHEHGQLLQPCGP